MSRIRESYPASVTPKQTIVAGGGAAARVVIAAALIMTAIFASYVDMSVRQAQRRLRVPAGGLRPTANRVPERTLCRSGLRGPFAIRRNDNAVVAIDVFSGIVRTVKDGQAASAPNNIHPIKDICERRGCTEDAYQFRHRQACARLAAYPS